MDAIVIYHSSTIMNFEVTPCIKTCLEVLNMLPTSPILMLRLVLQWIENRLCDVGTIAKIIRY